MLLPNNDKSNQRKQRIREPLAAQCLGLGAFSAVGPGSMRNQDPASHTAENMQKQTPPPMG